MSSIIEATKLTKFYSRSREGEVFGFLGPHLSLADSVTFFYSYIGSFLWSVLAAIAGIILGPRPVNPKRSACVPCALLQLQSGRLGRLVMGMIGHPSSGSPSSGTPDPEPLADLLRGGRTTFQLREALGVVALDLFGFRRGFVRDLAMQRPGSRAIDLILDDGAEARIVEPGAVVLTAQGLVADIAERDRLRGSRSRSELRLGSDIVGKRVLLLTDGTIGRVEDVRLTMRNGRTEVDEVMIIQGPVWRKRRASTGWMHVAFLDAIDFGLGWPHHVAQLSELSESEMGPLLLRLAPTVASDFAASVIRTRERLTEEKQ